MCNLSKKGISQREGSTGREKEGKADLPVAKAGTLESRKGEEDDEQDELSSQLMVCVRAYSA